MAGLPLILGAVQGIGQFAAGQAQAGQQEQQAAVAAQNAVLERQIATQNAATVRAEGVREAEDIRRQGQRAVARTQAAFGASGVEITGSPLSVLADNILEARFKENQALRASQARATGIQFRGTLAERQNQFRASSLRSSAGSSRMAGAFGGATSLLGGIQDFRSLNGTFF